MAAPRRPATAGGGDVGFLHNQKDLDARNLLSFFDFRWFEL
jgi:hypothetical protein